MFNHPYYTTKHPKWIPSNYDERIHITDSYLIREIILAILTNTNGAFLTRIKDLNVITIDIYCIGKFNIEFAMKTVENNRYMIAECRDNYVAIDKYLYETIRDLRATLNAELIRATNRDI
jgi:DNA-binding phage protein